MAAILDSVATTIRGYYGTSAPFDTFSIRKAAARRPDLRMASLGAFFATTPEEGSRDGRYVLVADIELQYPLHVGGSEFGIVWDFDELVRVTLGLKPRFIPGTRRPMGPHPEEFAACRRELLRQGRDGIIHRGSGGRATAVVLRTKAIQPVAWWART